MGRSRRALAVAVAALGGAVIAACSGTAPSRQHVATATRLPSPTPTSATTSAALATTRTARPPANRASSHVGSPDVSAASHRASARLPLPFPTGTATQVITVTAPSTSSTQGTLQAWRKVNGGWRRVGTATHAWLGSDGLSAQPSETRSAAPIGSFSLTRAFGHDADPGTALPYTRTTPSDWWISQPGRLYNTMQSCISRCAFTQGSPNEHLYYETPYYNYAVVIDYNTRNAPGGVRQGAGSAFFLHVSVGAPTQGCVSIVQPRLVGLLHWLVPSAHPRILIGTT